MRCARCNRPLDKPAMTVGKHWLGPVCAKTIKAEAPKPRFRASVAVPEEPTTDPRQMALQLEAA